MGDTTTMKEKKLLKDHLQVLSAKSWPFSEDIPLTISVIKKHMKQCPALLKGDRNFSPEEAGIIEETRQSMIDWVSKGKS